MSGKTTIDPRSAVLGRLEARHAHFVHLERAAWKAGRTAEAEGAHHVAIWILRAYAGERDDPKPRERP